jgi:hypothetical protein
LASGSTVRVLKGSIVREREKRKSWGVVVIEDVMEIHTQLSYIALSDRYPRSVIAYYIHGWDGHRSINTWHRSED